AVKKGDVLVAVSSHTPLPNPAKRRPRGYASRFWEEDVATWFTTAEDGDGRGNAVVLADSTDQLPSGGDDTSRGAATALPGTRTRMLAGKVEPLPVPGWVRLSAARYAPAVLPLDLAPGTDLTGVGAATPVVVVDAVEYVEEDEHGNTGVVDRRLTRLRLADHDELRLHLTDEED
ncbi:MAG: hypothetical protein P8Z68_11235, partial [Kineosporiaceae bacterium]